MTRSMSRTEKMLLMALCVTILLQVLGSLKVFEADVNRVHHMIRVSSRNKRDPAWSALLQTKRDLRLSTSSFAIRKESAQVSSSSTNGNTTEQQQVQQQENEETLKQQLDHEQSIIGIESATQVSWSSSANANATEQQQPPKGNISTPKDETSEQRLDRERIQLILDEMTPQLDNWTIISADSASPPYTDMVPHVHVVWSRGWYNAVPLPSTVPIKYYNDLGRDTRAEFPTVLTTYMTATSVCETGYVWIRGNDLSWFARTIVPQLQCHVSIVTSDCDTDAPTAYIDRGINRGETILQSPWIDAWYSQNVVTNHSKMHAIPIGIPIHYGNPGAKHSLDTLRDMSAIRAAALPLTQREGGIFYPKGTMTRGADRRNAVRNETYVVLSKCASTNGSANTNSTLTMQVGGQPVMDFWKSLATHQFAVAPTGVGWDTFRVWESLFFGAVPIIKRSPLTEFLLEPAHVPVWVVDDWKEVCDVLQSDDQAVYDGMLEKYANWMEHVHEWLDPSLWVPRNQVRMDQLCKASAGCRSSNEGSLLSNGRYEASG